MVTAPCRLPSAGTASNRTPGCSDVGWLLLIQASCGVGVRSPRLGAHGMHRPNLAGLAGRPIKKGGFRIPAFPVTPIAAATAKRPFDFSFEFERYLPRSAIAIVADGAHYRPAAKPARVWCKNLDELAQDGWLGAPPSRHRPGFRASLGRVFAVFASTARGIGRLPEGHHSTAVGASAHGAQARLAHNETEHQFQDHQLSDPTHLASIEKQRAPTDGTSSHRSL
jgi:hypothetical protein